MIEFLMKKVLMIGFSVLFFSILFVMLRTNKEMNGDLHIKQGSFIEGLKIVQKKNGRSVWTLTAQRADFLGRGDKAALSNVSVAVQENDLVLHVDKGVYNLSDKSFTTDSVVKAEAKDYTITADSIDYEISSGEIRTDGRIKVEGKGFIVDGRGMRADSEQKVSILSDVTATFHK